VRPSANLHNLGIVQVLTSGAGTRPSSLSGLATSLRAGQSASSGEQLASTQVGG